VSGAEYVGSTSKIRKVDDCSRSSTSSFCFTKLLINYVGYLVLVSVVIKIHMFLDITPRGPLKINRCFRRTSNFRNYHNPGHYSLSWLLFKTWRFGDWILSRVQVKPTQFGPLDRPSLCPPNQTGEQEQKRAAPHLVSSLWIAQTTEWRDRRQGNEVRQTTQVHTLEAHSGSVPWAVLLLRIRNVSDAGYLTNVFVVFS
jgi:hypothetical protein